MNKIIITILLTAFSSALLSQKYYTRNGVISFTSEAPMEKIVAKNRNATSVFDSESGAIEWAVLIKAFEFKKALMQEHFNENYMESSKYPKATFKGKFSTSPGLNFSDDGAHEVPVSGILTIHGISRDINTTAIFTVNDKTISATCSLTLAVADYNIEIPKLVRDNIAKEVIVDLTASYQILNR